jgi:acyl-CoA thioester hydrolase
MKELSETIDVRVRFSEVDPIRMVWHGAYVKYMEDAREAFGRKYHLEYMRIFNAGYFAPVYDMHLRYFKPGAMDDVLEVKIKWMPAIGGKLCFSYEIRRRSDGELLLQAETIQLFTTSNGDFDPSEPDFYADWKKQNGV